MISSPDLTLSIIKTAIALAVVLAVIWVLYRLSRGKLGQSGNTGRGQWIQILESRYIGVKKSIALVQVPGEVLVLGISADGVNLLSKINDPQVMADLGASGPHRIQSGFLSFFQRATQRQAGKVNHNPSSPFDGSKVE